MNRRFVEKFEQLEARRVFDVEMMMEPSLDLTETDLVEEVAWTDKEPSTNPPQTLTSMNLIREVAAPVPESPPGPLVPLRRSIYLTTGLRLIATTCLALLLVKIDEKEVE